MAHLLGLFDIEGGDTSEAVADVVNEGGEGRGGGINIEERAAVELGSSVVGAQVGLVVGILGKAM